ncbi:peptidylprolyl isomerase [Tenacibaculum sp. MEBiC06402]|uniref:peptidylprolyl isomerase n=1 Tax=unclassified Tenacibaculum TaxID=2635139 RepID=UPI003B9B159B
MKKIIIAFVLLFFGFQSFAQKDKVLLTINDNPVYVSEFKRVYEKNLDQISESEKDIDKNLELFVNYKLKLQEAYNLKLDTSRTYKSEFKSYKNQLMTPYLQDEDFKKTLVKEAYERTIEEVRASHILISYSKKSAKRDSTEIIKVLDSIKLRIKNGEDFGKLAREYSDDPSAKMNGGDLGYFNAFRMVYPFEKAAYETAVDNVSEPFKTRFGYHILKVTDKRMSKGAFEVAHILARDNSIVGKVKIDSVYQKLQNGASFEELAKKYSEDKGSAVNGGMLPKFSSGRMVPAFENEVFNLKEEGTYSKPFKTRYGWHIVKLIKNYPVKSFEQLKPELEARIRTSNRGKLSLQKLISDLKKKYKVVTNTNLLDKVVKDRNTEFSEDKEKEGVLTIEKKEIALKEFLDFIKNKRYLTVENLWKKFEDQEVLNYYKEDLVNIFPEYKNTLQEYKDGLLLFDLMKTKIWDASQKDDEGLTIYFKENSKKYKSQDLSKIKGEVINDYQKYLEEKWLSSLRKENKVKINNKVLKKLKKQYNQ